MRVPGKRLMSSAATGLGSASPQNSMTRSDGMRPWPKPWFARHISANDGVETHTCGSDFSRNASMSAARSSVAFSMAKSSPPLASDMDSSYTDRSNENGAWFKKRVPGPSTPATDSAQGKKLSTQDAVTTTPLGAPVEPEVKMT